MATQIHNIEGSPPLVGRPNEVNLRSVFFGIIAILWMVIALPMAVIFCVSLAALDMGLAGMRSYRNRFPGER
jgi:hypothetical protein